ncbi:MAG TPA: hypothetical protein VH164_17005, partial [Ktedonobacteraceae bacterium]|nr:hypothetical protein [Ktedonobacteraceae bacterium]
MFSQHALHFISEHFQPEPHPDPPVHSSCFPVMIAEGLQHQWTIFPVVCFWIQVQKKGIELL